MSGLAIRLTERCIVLSIRVTVDRILPLYIDISSHHRLARNTPGVVTSVSKMNSPNPTTLDRSPLPFLAKHSKKHKRTIDKVIT